MQDRKSKRQMLADLRRFEAAAMDQTKSESQRRVYALSAQNVRDKINEYYPDTTNQTSEPAAITPQNKSIDATQKPSLPAPPNIQRIEPDPASAAVHVKETRPNARIVVSESDQVRRIEIIWPGEKEPQIFDLTAISKLFHMTFNDLCKSWAAREKDYARLPERSPKGWTKATTLYYAAYVLSGEWLTAKRIGVQNMAPAVRRTVFQMIVEQAQKM